MTAHQLTSAFVKDANNNQEQVDSLIKNSKVFFSTNLKTFLFSTGYQFGFKTRPTT